MIGRSPKRTRKKGKKEKILGWGRDHIFPPSLNLERQGSERSHLDHFFYSSAHHPPQTTKHACLIDTTAAPAGHYQRTQRPLVQPVGYGLRCDAAHPLARVNAVDLAVHSPLRRGDKLTVDCPVRTLSLMLTKGDQVFIFCRGRQSETPRSWPRTEAWLRLWSERHIRQAPRRQRRVQEAASSSRPETQVEKRRDTTTAEAQAMMPTRVEEGPKNRCASVELRARSQDAPAMNVGKPDRK